jgi:glucose/arabinose dehydrogenase
MSRRSAAARAWLLLLAGVSLLSGCAFGAPNDSDAGGPPRLARPSASPDSSDDPPGVVATVLARGFEVPWGLAFLPDGGALVTERDRHTIVKIGPGSGPDGLTITPVQTLAEVTGGGDGGEGGLLGIAASRTYATDRTVYVYYTTSVDNRIARLRIGGRPVPIVTGIPAGPVHNGGQLAFGPDGYLYASTGDASTASTAQDLTSLGGKILRMTTDGRPAPGNPFPRSLVWSYGHRNVEGLAWDAGRRLFATEFGQNTWDELNLIRPGKNYGWPTVEGAADDPRFADPLTQWSPQDASCSGTAVAGQTLVVACLRGARLYLVRLTDSGTVLGAPVPVFVGTYGRLRAAVLAPDGSIWVSTSNRDRRGVPRDGDDRILRIVVGDAGTIGKS